MREKINMGKNKRIGVLVVLGIFIMLVLIPIPVTAALDEDWNENQDNVMMGYATAISPGNCGIGTDSPMAKAHIVQTDAEDAFRVDDETSDSTPFLVDKDGNVGIGTATPQRLLHLSLAGSPELVIENSGANTNQKIWRIRGQSGSVSNLHFDTVYDDFSAGTNIMTLTRPPDGYVGIGTSNPGAKLEVAGAIKISGPVPGTHIFYGTNEFAAPTGDGYRIRYDNNFFGTNDDALIIEKTDANDLVPDGGIAFVNTGYLGGVETAMVIRGDGNVGIGIIEPTSDLHIEGNSGEPSITLQPNVPYGDPEINLLCDPYDGYGMTIKAKSANMHLSFYRKTPMGLSSPLFTIHELGNVGIGTDRPMKKLDIIGDVRISSHLTVDTNTLYVDATSNNVGIGTASPSKTLTVSGSNNINIKFPDGLDGTSINQDIYGGYTVPCGETLYLLTAYNSNAGSNYLKINNSVYFGFADYGRISFDSPLVVPGGSVISSSNSYLRITGLLIDEDIDVINDGVESDNGHPVPIGKTLYVFTAHNIKDGINYFIIDESGESYWKFLSRDSITFDSPLVVPGGSTLYGGDSGDPIRITGLEW